MANSILTYPGSAGFGPYAATFTLGKLRDAYVQVRVNEEVDGLDAPLYRDIEWISDTMFNITSGTEPTTPDTVTVLRTIPDDQLIHDYSNGAVIEELNLDESNLQCIMLIHQFLDGRLTATLANDLDMGGHRIINLGDAIDDQDAATKGQLVALVADAQAILDATIVAKNQAVSAKNSADADVVLTHADVVTTAANVVTTANNVTTTNNNVTTTNTNVTTTATNAATATTQAGIATAQAVIATAKAVLTAADASATAADRVQTGLDRTQTGLDRTQTGLDATATAGDRVQTGLDKTQTAADRVATGNDATNTSAYMTAAQGYANAAAASAAGISMRKSCDYATTGAVTATYNNGASGVGATLTVTATGVFSLDGNATALNDVALFKDQASAFQNGIYVCTTAGAVGVSAVWTRSTDYDTPTEMKEGTATIITQGTVNASHIYVMTKNGGVVTVGTTACDWTSLTATATSANTLSTPRLIGGVSFDGSTDITPTQIQPASEVSDTTCFPLLVNAASGTAQQPKYNSSLGYNASTGALNATSFTGAGTGLTGTASSLTAGNVTTNANLTGDVTSAGNVTTIGAGKVTEAMQVTADNTTQNVSTAKHGYMPKLTNDGSKSLADDGVLRRRAQLITRTICAPSIAADLSGTYTPNAQVRRFWVVMNGSTSGHASSAGIGGQGGPGYSEKLFSSPSGSYSWASARNGNTTFGGVITIAAPTAPSGVTAGVGAATPTGGDYNVGGGNGGAGRTTATAAVGGNGCGGTRAGVGGAGGAAASGVAGAGGGSGGAASGATPGIAATVVSGSALTLPFGQMTEIFYPGAIGSGATSGGGCPPTSSLDGFFPGGPTWLGTPSVYNANAASTVVSGSTGTIIVIEEY